MNNKRGLAAEMAIVAMLTVAALCTVLLVVSRMMQKTATNDYTYIVASAETNQVAEDFVAALSDENAASFDENIFKGNHPSFDGFITIDVSAADENADVYTLSVTHPAGKVAVAVAVRVERAADGPQSSHLVFWRQRII